MREGGRKVHAATAWYHEQRGRRVCEQLRRRNFHAYYVPDRAQALVKVLELIPADARVGFGGSMTLEEIGVIKALQERGNELITKPHARGAERIAQRRQALLSDVFLTSTNAVTLDGILVNVDALGNRVGAMAFGPRQTVMVFGVNKIVADLEAALHRAQAIASPINAKRLNRTTPCTVTGECSDCNSPDRICNITTIIERRPLETEFAIVVVGEALGF